ncbi:hypothetical protein LTR62_008433 [Meristemomyces frigidus]|uniref:Protein kinase domain-containing protein n=1 Tax=Meristemomyces frigidus TaxID=1508187 RepID=A0AAN7TI19_9PEZI|nr:hypothetical protein LTR62_008433 [Meristemomyces frigidus]
MAAAEPPRQMYSHRATKSLGSRRRQPPAAPLRTHSEYDSGHPEASPTASPGHARHKSTALPSGVSRRGARYTRRASEQPSDTLPISSRSHRAAESIPEIASLEVPGTSGVLSPPLTPIKSHDALNGIGSPLCEPAIQTMQYDFSRLDYELDRAKVIGTGLWSTVYLADGKNSPPRVDENAPPSPPMSPHQKRVIGPSSLYAVKVPARADAKEVFQQEAKILSHLMLDVDAAHYVVPFRGFDSRNSSLVFDAVIGGSLENLNGRLQQMTEVARHVELVNIFPGLTDDLVSGLEFLHISGVVHADIKPANILLGILPRPVIRARYIDFSASFRLESNDSTANAGGTWDYMAPEQLRTPKELSTPTSASDVWSLGITLLTLIVGGSPYTAACGDNLFMLREAIKSGDPLGFARMEPRARKRLAACQDFIDCCRQALKKDRERRLTAAAWKVWLVNQDLVM